MVQSAFMLPVPGRVYRLRLSSRLSGQAHTRTGSRQRADKCGHAPLNACPEQKPFNGVCLQDFFQTQSDLQLKATCKLKATSKLKSPAHARAGFFAVGFVVKALASAIASAFSQY